MNTRLIHSLKFFNRSQASKQNKLKTSRTKDLWDPVRYFPNNVTEEHEAPNEYDYVSKPMFFIFRGDI